MFDVTKNTFHQFSKLFAWIFHWNLNFLFKVTQCPQNSLIKSFKDMIFKFNVSTKENEFTTIKVELSEIPLQSFSLFHLLAKQTLQISM